MTRDDYLAAVAAELADLPDDDWTDLLDDVEAHLADVANEHGEAALVARLGEPAAFAAELRTSAGLPPKGRPRSAPLRALRDARSRLTGSRSYREVAAFLPELRPAWWVVRGWLLVVGVAFVTHDSLRAVLPLPHLGESAALGVAATAGAVVASVALGRRRGRGLSRAVAVAASVLALLCGAVVWVNADDRMATRYYPVRSPEKVFVTSGGPIGNIFPYDRDGRPLSGVRLYAENGRSLSDLVCGYCPNRGEGTFPLPELRPDPETGTLHEVAPKPPIVFATPTPKPAPKPKPKPSPTK